MSLVSATNLPIFFQVQTAAKIEEVIAKDSEIEERVAELIESHYRDINVDVAMTQLGWAGELLLTAYATSKGAKCNSAILEIYSQYQEMIHKASNSCSDFVNQSFKSLKFHRDAFEIAMEENPKETLEVLAKVSKIAEKMSSGVQALIVVSESLCNKSKVVLISASQEEYATKEERESVQKTIQEFEEGEAALQQKLKHFAICIEERRQEEARARKDAQDAESKAFTISIISAIAAPVTAVAGAVVKVAQSRLDQSSIAKQLIDELEKLSNKKDDIKKFINEKKIELERKKKNLAEAVKDDQKNSIGKEIDDVEDAIKIKKLELEEQENTQKQLQIDLAKAQEQFDNAAQGHRKREENIAQARWELQKQQVEDDASLAKTLAKLKGAKIKDNSLANAITALELTVKTLGKVKTIFLNTQTFWDEVKLHCEDLTDHAANMENKSKNPERLVKAIVDSGIEWFSLVKVNATAADKIRAVKNTVDEGMSNLPTSAEAERKKEALVQKLSLAFPEGKISSS